jgi:quercetin dioxygenase-like cupin family protein
MTTPDLAQAPTFLPFDLSADLQVERRDGDYPCTVRSWRQSGLALAAGATHYGYVWQGAALLSRSADNYTLHAGMYFALPGAGQIVGTDAGIVISRWDETAFFHLGGPIETSGRLRYIDGCTDSLLIPPVVHGQACLNLLHIPPHTRQSAHTHPSLRAGLIVSGQGHCVTPQARHALYPGLAFLIAPHGLHSFHTEAVALQVIAFHPDSDFGPTHTNHPMLNRTYRSSR